MKPFDLEAAKRGEPLVLRDGRKVRFVAHVPDAHAIQRVIVVTESGGILAYNDKNGMARLNCVADGSDLLMAPPPMRSIGGYEYPEPATKPLEDGQTYWVGNPVARCLYVSFIWAGSANDHHFLRRGLIQLTTEGAIAQATAMILAGGGEV